MLQMEWKRATDWIPHRVNRLRWLLIHRLDKPVSNNEDWPLEDMDMSDNEKEETDFKMQEQKAHRNKFGPIPRFSRVYEVTVTPNTNVFSCTCCNQQRMGMPCRHIAAVCQDNHSLALDENGFPLSSV
jgi:hypothetical protein